MTPAMPTYEYACTTCGRRFDVVQSFSDAPLTVCEVCGGTLKRVFHPVGIVLKGSGFYSTDNRGGKKFTPPGDKKESSGSGSSDSGSSGSESSGSSTDAPSKSEPAKKSETTKKSETK
jgi:putative FmdB family regulatory protein